MPNKMKVVEPQSSFHLVWWKTWSENFLEPIHTILVFEVLILRPEKLEKNSMISNSENKDSEEPSRVNEVSSAYCDILCSLSFMIYLYFV